MHILLIHGALGARHQLASLERALGDAHDVNVVELEGHGSTNTSHDRYEMSRFVDNARDELARRGIDRTGVFGYSMGGYVALSLAAQAPELVSAVATLGTKLAWSPEVAMRETSRLDPATIRAKVPKFAAALEARHGGAGGWETVLARTARLMSELGDRPTLDAQTLSGLAQPVRLMVGDRDNVVTIEETVAAARSMAKGESAVLPNTAHAFEQARASLIADLLRDFFV